jgi:hypothetical protein
MAFGRTLDKALSTTPARALALGPSREPLSGSQPTVPALLGSAKAPTQCPEGDLF